MDSDGVSIGRNALESSLTQLNKEHVDVLVRLRTQTPPDDLTTESNVQNQLVMARLRNEELEGELVRYKLL